MIINTIHLLQVLVLPAFLTLFNTVKTQPDGLTCALRLFY